MGAGLGHPHARAILEEAWKLVHPGEAAMTAALQIAGGVAILESGYGQGSYKNNVNGESSGIIHNWGAIQGSAVDPSRGMTGGFDASDFDSTTGKTFTAFYQKYADDVSGAAHMLRLLDNYAPEALRAGDIDRFSREMYIGAQRGGTIEHPKGYFGGTHVLAGKTGDARLAAAEANIETHAAGVWKGVQAIAASLGEPVAAQRGGPMTSEPMPGGGEGGGGEGGGPGLGAACAVATGLYLLYRAFKG